MSSRTSISKTLFRLYEHYVGEPDSGKDVYGYWLFVFGFVLGAVAVVLYAINFEATQARSSAEFFVNRIVGVVGLFGATIGLFGLVLMLPVRRRAIQASAAGLVVSLVGVVSFGVVYPDHWRGIGTPPDYTLEVIAVFSVGVGIIAGVAALVPVVTGRKAKYLAEEGVTDDPEVLTGDALEGAQFAVFRDGEGDWRWRILHLEALAENDRSAVTRPDAESGIEDVKSRIGSAGLMELTTSAFRLYEREDGRWQWTLIREDGSVVARCGEEFPEQDGAEESVSFLKDRGPGADVIEIEGAAFTYHEARDAWHWDLLDDDRTPMASSPTGYDDQAIAEDAASTFADRFAEARVLDVDHVGVELREREDGWAWRFVDADDEELAASATDFETRRDAEEAVEALLPELSGAPVTIAGEPSYERYRSGEEWRWRLVDGSERVVARSPSGATDPAELDRGAGAFADHAADADVVEIEDADYELYPADGVSLEYDEDADLPAVEDDLVADGGATVESDDRTWHWRLVTEDREVVAASTQPHDRPDDAAAAIERMREQAEEADLIEFEEAAFQVYEADSGEWRWRLIDEDGNVLADSGEEHTSRSEAAEAMMTLKEQAPEAELLEIETAAFELFVDENDRWGWRLIDEAGKLVAEDPATHPTRGAARKAMNRLLEHLDADVREMDRAIFQTYAADDDWHWRFVLPSGTVVADGTAPHPTRDELVDALPAVREAATTATSHTIDDVAVQLRGNGEWRFRLLDRDREVLAESSDSYPDRDAVAEVARDLERNAADAPIFTIETAAIRLSDAEGGWSWDLVDRDRTVLASGATAAESKSELVETVEEIRSLVSVAGRVDFDVASFEVFADRERDDRWRWRLIDEDGHTVATGEEAHDTSERAREAVADVRDLIADASILEIEGVSFELHADGDGWVWRLVDQHGETMLESTRTYGTRTDAREAMDAVKSHAPEGWITFTE